MHTTAYKVMLALTPDERRGLNTLAAIGGLTPNRYVEATLRSQLRTDLAALGLPLPPVHDDAPIPGQLVIAEARPASSRGRRAKGKPAPIPKEEKTPRRRTRS